MKYLGTILFGIFGYVFIILIPERAALTPSFPDSPPIVCIHVTLFYLTIPEQTTESCHIPEAIAAAVPGPVEVSRREPTCGPDEDFKWGICFGGPCFPPYKELKEGRRCGAAHRHCCRKD